MKSNLKSSRVSERYGMIEPLESRIAPAAVVSGPLISTVKSYRTATASGTLLLKAGDMLTTGTAGGGSYLLFVEQGQVLVHVTDLNGNNQLDSNEITGLSVGNGASLISFTDIHGDVVTDLNPDGTLTDGGRGDILLDANIASIDLRSLAATDFVGTAAQSPAQLVAAHLTPSSYSIFGNIYAGGGLGLPNTPTSGLHIDTSGASLQSQVYNGGTGDIFYQPSTPVIGSIYAGSAASGHSFSFGATGNPFTIGPSGPSGDVNGNLLTFTPRSGEAGASIYNIGSASSGQNFSIGTIHAGDGGFNAPGGSIVNVALQGDNAGVYQLIAGNAGSGTTGQVGGSIVNFSESGAFLSEVVLQSGNGGTGLVGAGGTAGNIILNPAAPIQINAHLVINYGSGGDGYTHGGAGGGTPSGTFITPNGQLTLPQNLTTTMHTPGAIGSTTPIEFTTSGYSDAVFSTTNPNQVVVALGGSYQGEVYNYKTQQFDPQTIYQLNSDQYYFLNAPAQVDSITVGNFNGAVIPGTNKPALDIAVISGVGSNAGIEVFLSQYNQKTGQFEGFSDPLFSPLPSLAQVGFYDSTITGTKIMAGDFNPPVNGIQAEGIAVLVQETDQVTKLVESVLINMSPETNAQHPYGTGYFYAAQGEPFQLLGLVSKFDPHLSVFQVSPLAAFDPHNNTNQSVDMIFEAGSGAKNFQVVSFASGFPEIVSSVGFGKVDTNRDVGDKNVSSTDFQVQGLAIVPDPGNPAIADVVALSKSPADFLVTLQGDGAGNFTVQSGTGDQAGFKFGGDGSNPVAIVAAPVASGHDPIVAVLDYQGAPSDIIYTFDIGTTPATTGATPQPAVPLGSPLLLDTLFSITPDFGRNSSLVAFDVYIPHPTANANLLGSGPTSYGFILGNPLQTYPDASVLAVSQPTGEVGFDLPDNFSFAPLKEAGYVVNAGHGGNSQSGAGGAGGGLGEALVVSGSGQNITATGSLSFVLPSDVTYEGNLVLTSGNGGNGFTGGGHGGNLSGVSIVYSTSGLETSTASLMAGNGGESLTGTGGAGGNLNNLYVFSGEYFTAGNGGVGVIGGAGGSLTGNLQPGLITASTNSLTDTVILTAGAGADGINGGGNGGGITSFVNDFLPATGSPGGILSYTAGNGGGAVAGHAGSGGSVVNSSPSITDDNLAGSIELIGGNGGSGLYGGNGGAITSFAQISTIRDIPTDFTVLSGAGGNSTLGSAGAGGDISQIQIAAVGLGGFVGYNRMVAGPGGSSAGGTGGHGGSISNINTTSTASTAQNVVAAGAGGDGLLAGGNGGNVTSASVDSGSGGGEGKVLVIAGDGGSSASVAPGNAKDALSVAAAIGGVNGPGGKGGSINGFTQPVSTTTHVDLIAGNGGATLNHSVAAGNATVDNSGVGGSVLNVSVQGTIGNLDPYVAIKSYNDFNQGQTMQQFVDQEILTGYAYALDDTAGNVGIVAGEAGRVEGGSPSTDGINGSVANITATSIMSIVAGSVDEVALVQDLTGYTATSGHYGAMKLVSALGYTPYIAVGPNSPDNYISPDGSIVPTPLPGGALIDGALLGMNSRTTHGRYDFNGTE